MNELLGKIGTYNLFNYLLPGVIFSVFVTKFTPYNLIQADALSGAFVYYFIGLVVSRIGSLMIEPILKKVRFVTFSSYEDFLHASKEDQKIEILLEANNMYRTICSLFFCISITYGYSFVSISFPILGKILPVICIFGLLILFSFSYRKQTAYIVKRISSFRNKE